jgi:tRNA nucleotidyltransferase (CCA-adding enzyme)
MSDNPSDGIYDLHNTKMLKYFGMDELDKCFGFEQHNIHHNRDVADHTLYALSNSENDLLLRLAILLHDIGKPSTHELKDGHGTFYAHHKTSADIARGIMELLRYSNKEIDIVNKLIYNHMCRYYKYTNKSIKKLINRVGSDNLDRLYKLMVCDRFATKPPYDFEDIYMLKFKCDKFLSEKQPLDVKDLAVNGNDLISIGFKQGKEIGTVLNSLMEIVLEDEKYNDRDFLLVKANELKSEF